MRVAIAAFGLLLLALSATAIPQCIELEALGNVLFVSPSGTSDGPGNTTHPLDVETASLVGFICPSVRSWVIWRRSLLFGARCCVVLVSGYVMFADSVWQQT